jgi:hypothetical protein
VIGLPPESGATQDKETDVSVLVVTDKPDGAPGTEAAAADIDETPRNESDGAVDDRRVKIFDSDGRLGQIALGTPVTPTGAVASDINVLPGSERAIPRAGSTVAPIEFCSAGI